MLLPKNDRVVIDDGHRSQYSKTTRVHWGTKTPAPFAPVVFSLARRIWRAGEGMTLEDLGLVT
jgi:hypothetical protein